MKFGAGVEVVQLPPLNLGKNDLPKRDYDMGDITFDPCYIQDDDDGGDPILSPATNEWLQTFWPMTFFRRYLWINKNRRYLPVVDISNGILAKGIFG